MFLTVKNSLKTCLIVSGPLWNFLNICNTHLTLFYCILPLVTFLIHPKILKSQKKFIVFKKMTDISHKIVIDWVCRYDRGIFTEPNIGFYYETMRFNLCFIKTAGIFQIFSLIKFLMCITTQVHKWLACHLHIKWTFTVVLKTEQSLIYYTDGKRNFENCLVSFVPNGTF